MGPSQTQYNYSQLWARWFEEMTKGEHRGGHRGQGVCVCVYLCVYLCKERGKVGEKNNTLTSSLAPIFKSCTLQQSG